MRVAALYVDEAGPYVGLPGVDAWGVTRDARLYAGPDPVVAHPPCERWGRYATGGPRADPTKPGFQPRKRVGDDGGCFASALAAVRRWGGVLEHPEASKAWAAFGLVAPPRGGGWVRCLDGGWTCCVEQGWYGHRARKATWLYVAGYQGALPALRWGNSGQRLVGPAGGTRMLEVGDRPGEDYARRRRIGMCACLPKSQRHITPVDFRDLLLRLAESCSADP